MGENKREGIKPEKQKAEIPKKEETPDGVTVGMGTYKPIPKFRGNCKNC